MRVCRSRYARKAISGVPIARLGRFSQRCLWGSKTPVWLRDLGVFVDQATEGFPASDPCLLDVDHAWERAGFSPARRMTSLRMSRRVDGRPECPARHLAAHRRRSRSRCQRKIVSGVTTSRNPVRRGLRITLVNAAISPRSAQVNLSACAPAAVQAHRAGDGATRSPPLSKTPPCRPTATTRTHRQRRDRRTTGT
jgi:hypothetical protein